MTNRDYIKVFEHIYRAELLCAVNQYLADAHRACVERFDRGECTWEEMVEEMVRNSEGAAEVSTTVSYNTEYYYRGVGTWFS